jgi:hypothetical protein
MKKIILSTTILMLSSLNALTLNSGFNMVKASADLTLSSSSLGGNITKIYGISSNAQGYVSYDPSKASFLNSLKSTEDGNVYLVVTSSASTGECSTVETPPTKPSITNVDQTPTTN